MEAWKHGSMEAWKHGSMEAVYLKAPGLSHQEIGRIVRISQSQTTLREYLLLYQQGGIAALQELNFNQPKRDLDKHQESLRQELEQKPPASLVEATCSYKSPAFFGERLRVGLGVSRFGGKSFDLVYQLVAEGDGRLVATGKTVMVVYDYESGQTMPLSDDFKVRLPPYGVELGIAP